MKLTMTPEKLQTYEKWFARMAGEAMVNALSVDSIGILLLREIEENGNTRWRPRREI